MTVAALKRCARCRQERAREEFSKSNKNRDGLQSWCRPCMNEDARMRWEIWPRKRDQSEQARQKHRERNRRYRAQRPEVRAAHDAVRRAIASGRLERPAKCEACKQTRELDAHHEDYSKKLEVVWLCATCHSRVHFGLLTLDGSRGRRPEAVSPHKEKRSSVG